ncbi:MAG: ABC transporter ATP-binding protein [Bacteroidetes bacterium]|nr:ABC transporter ATP-binding protein [Bacteroidota bacterium]
MSSPVIQVSNLTKEYYIYKRAFHRIIDAFGLGKKQNHRVFSALSGVDFNVNKGEAVGIIGRNGSGKSTLLQAICNIIQPTVGGVEVDGRISALLELGAGFNPEFSGRENVYLSTAINGLSKAETDERFDSIVNFAEIGDFIDQPVKTYSSGMYVRLAFATAINIDPDILIVDEALAVGDIFFQQKCMQHMKEMMEKCTIIMVTHDMHAVSTLCDRVLVLDSGNVLFDGEPLDGIALYTKLMHTERFADKQKIEQREGIEFPATSDAFASGAVKDIVPDPESWITVVEEKRGGAGDIEILRVKITKDGELFQTVSKGEIVEIAMLVKAHRKVEDIIVGYTLKDRVGVAIFGENSMCLPKTQFSFEEGLTIVRYSFEWPEVYPEEYTLTLGIGEGKHPMIHTIQCWAHNIFSFHAIVPDGVVHGIFNNPITSFEVVEINN